MTSDKKRQGEQTACKSHWGITSLCKGDSVVLQKDDFQAVSDHRVIVDHLTNGCDQTDNHLGCVVSRSSLQERTVVVKRRKKVRALPVQPELWGFSVEVQTFPPIMTVLGVHCLLGSFLMPVGDMKTLQDWGIHTHIHWLAPVILVNTLHWLLFVVYNPSQTFTLTLTNWCATLTWTSSYFIP